MYWLGVCILATLVASGYAECPHDDTTSLTERTDASSLGTTWTINTGVLLNTDVDVDYIDIIQNGQLVLKPGRDFTIRAKGILVRGNGKFIIGGNNDDCRFRDKVNIILKGQRSLTAGPEGDKYIVAKEEGTINFNGAKKLAWTKLATTIDRYDSVALDDGEYVHSKTTDFTSKTGRQGLVMHRFNSNLEKLSYEAYDFFIPTNVPNEQKNVNQSIAALAALADGDVVGISIQNLWKWTSGTTLVDNLYTALETASGFTSVDLRDADTLDAFSMVFVKGTDQPRCQHLDKRIGKGITKSECYITHSGKKISAMSVMEGGFNSKSHVDFRILNQVKGFPWITVRDDISTWNIGDSIVVTSTDYAYDHGEYRLIRDIDTTNNQIQVDKEFDYRHVSVLEKQVAMRAEVGLLTRNILVTGEMSRDCPDDNLNCDVGYDTVGGHIKVIHSFNEIYINSVSLTNMGQMPVKGAYPLHFHMCGDVADKTAKIEDVSIWNSYSRCVTVHGTRGRSATEMGVEVKNVVAYQIRGSCFFLEDGAEIWTLFQGNLGAEIRTSDNLWFTADKSKPSVFWITNPQTALIGNVAAGCEGIGIWYLFPDLPVEPSTSQNVFQDREARLTPLGVFDSNAVHSCTKGGFNFDNVLDDEHGNFSGCMNFKSLKDPKDSDSEWVWNYITRLTAYKNLDINVWIRGGWFIIDQLSAAESRRCFQLARSSNQQPEVRNSVCIGRSEGNYEADDYPGAVTGSKMKHYLGAVFYDGPVYVNDVYFHGYEKSATGQYAAGALGFKTKNVFSSSAASAVTGFLSGCEDTVDGLCNRIFDGNIDDADHGFGHFSGDETASFRDIDGSVSLCPGETFNGVMSIVKPEKFTYTSNCKYRANWKMYRCQELYAKIQAVPKGLTKDQMSTFSDAGLMKRIRYDDLTDTAYENHNEAGRKSEFLVVTGNNDYYYEFQYENNMPPKIQLVGKGIESNMPVVVGLCLPEGIGRSDITLSSTSTKDLSYMDDDMRELGSLTALRDSDQMNKFFIDGRKIYFKLNTIVPRKEGMINHDTDHCSTGTCPSFTVTFNTDFTYTRCSNPTEAELSTDVYLDGVPPLTCAFPASTQTPANLGLGAGEMFANVDGGLGPWSPWSDCCNEIGEPTTTSRERLCDNPIPYGDGAECSSEDRTEEQNCATSCPVAATVSQWGEWSDCYCTDEAENSTGARKRTRTLTKATSFGSFLPSTTDLVQYKACVGLCQYQ